MLFRSAELFEYLFPLLLYLRLTFGKCLAVVASRSGPFVSGKHLDVSFLVFERREFRYHQLLVSLSQQYSLCLLGRTFLPLARDPLSVDH